MSPVPVIGDRLPRRGNAFSRALGRGLLRLGGWRIEGEIPNLPKMVMIGAPHTSNMDGVVSLAALVAMGLDCSTMIKDSAFTGPLGWLLRWLGAIPINRLSPRGVVGQSIDAFGEREHLLLLLAPEGTRRRARDWKRGFHHIALGAEVPVLPAAIDYRRRRVVFGPVLRPGPDYEADLAQLTAFVARFGAARRPERLSRPVCEALGRDWPPHRE